MKVFNNTCEEKLEKYLCECYNKNHELYYITIRKYYRTSKNSGYHKDKIIVFDNEQFNQVIEYFKKITSCETSKYCHYWLTKLALYDNEIELINEISWNKK